MDNRLLKESESNDPKFEAQVFVERMQGLGYELDYSLKSLNSEIDQILRSPLFRNLDDKSNEGLTNSELIDQQRLESGIEAYIGETLCRLFDGCWSGFTSAGFGINFYSCDLKFGEFKTRISHFLSYRINHGEQKQGTFKKYLEGLLPKIKARN